MQDHQIKHMVDRFLSMKLPEDFNPDGGISYSKVFRPPHDQPSGTNLFSAAQMTEIVKHMLVDLPYSTGEDRDGGLG